MPKKKDKAGPSGSHNHSCPRRRCCCTSVNELAEQLEELKASRKKAEEAFTEKPEYHMTQAEAEMLEGDASLCAATLSRVQGQRDEMGKLMTELRELGELIAIREESVCETDKEITDLQTEVTELIEKLNKETSEANIEKKDEQNEQNEAAWRKAVALEIMEQDRLQKHMKRVSYSLTTQKMEEKLFEEKRFEQRKMDSKLLLCAVEYVEKCTTDSRKLIPREEREDYPE